MSGLSAASFRLVMSRFYLACDHGIRPDLHSVRSFTAGTTAKDPQSLLVIVRPLAGTGDGILCGTALTARTEHPHADIHGTYFHMLINLATPEDPKTGNKTTEYATLIWI
jgi:hypothetical protein